MARFCDAHIVKMMTSRPELPHGYVAGNRYMCGSGETQVSKADLLILWLTHSAVSSSCVLARKEEKRYKLSEEYGAAALQLLLDKVDAGSAVTVAEFVDQFCHPMRVLQSWKAQQLQQFGSLLWRSSAFGPDNIMTLIANTSKHLGVRDFDAAVQDTPWVCSLLPAVGEGWGSMGS